jgi:hypothetical protein
MLARLDKPLRRMMGAAKTAKAQIGEGLSLQSLLMSHGYTRSTRDGEAMLLKTIGVP